MQGVCSNSTPATTRGPPLPARPGVDRSDIIAWRGADAEPTAVHPSDATPRHAMARMQLETAKAKQGARPIVRT